MTRYSQLLLASSQLLLAGSLCAQPSVPEIPYDSAPNLLKMPEHIHMLLGEPQRATLADAMKSLKQGVSRRLVDWRCGALLAKALLRLQYLEL